MGNKLNASKLDLSHRDLKEIPDFVFECKNLKKLNLSNNRITSIPKELSKLKFLKNLDISNNLISNLYAKTFDLINLEVLMIGNNKLVSIPTQISNLQKLKKLGLQSNLLTLLPETFNKLSSLESLNLSNNRLLKFPDQILTIRSLKQLWLGNNYFPELPIASIKNELINLKSVYLFNNAQNNTSSASDPSYSVLQKFSGNSFGSLSILSPPDDQPIKIKKPVKERNIFISYSHKDIGFKDEIKTSLESMIQEGLDINYWSDDQISTGDEWKKEIEMALERATIAIFVVSNYFLASKFIQEVEIPPLIRKAATAGTAIIPVIARRCRFKESVLGKYQALNAPEMPLNSMPVHEQESMYYKLTKEIEEAFKS